jgi:hypothetical protein
VYVSEIVKQKYGILVSSKYNKKDDDDEEENKSFYFYTFFFALILKYAKIICFNLYRNKIQFGQKIPKIE